MMRLVASLCLILCAFAARADELRIIAWNVESGGANAAVISERLREFEGIDLWGLSEVESEDWIKSFRRAAGEHGGRFRYALGTTGRSDRLGVIYNTERFALLATSELHFANPEFRVRSPFVAHLVERESGVEFLFVVNHLYRGNEETKHLRHQQAEQLNQWATEQTLPIITAGDFNFDWDVENGEEDHDAGYDNLVAEQVFTWIRPEELMSTQGNPRFNSVLDFFFVSGDAQAWPATSEIIRTDGIHPSDRANPDHRPVLAIIMLPDVPGLDESPFVRRDEKRLQQLAPIDVGWWNIRNFSNNSRDDEEMALIAESIEGIEVLVVGELSDAEAIRRLAAELGPTWQWDATENRIGRTTNSAEYYGFVWDSASVRRRGDVRVFPDTDDSFDREPAFMTFQTIDGAYDFTVIGVHITWGRTVGPRKAEIRELDAVWDFVLNDVEDDSDILLFGDFNRNVGDDSFDDLFAIEGVLRGNPDRTPTHIRSTSSYDQVFISSQATTEWNGSFKIHKFDELLFDNDDSAANLACSDHRPISIRLEFETPDED